MASPVAISQKMDSNRAGNAQGEVFRVPTNDSTIITWSALGSRTKPSSRSAFDHMGSSRALVPESPLYAQTLDSGEWLMVARGWSGCATGFGRKLDKGGLARVVRA